MNQPEDHMDELFRKAGENYPLQTGGSDWDKVLAGLQSEPGPGVGPVAGVGSSAHGKKWRWLFLLLLLPIGWVGAYYSGWTGHHTSVSTSASRAGSTNVGSTNAGTSASVVPKSSATASASAGSASTGLKGSASAGAGSQASTDSAVAASAGAGSQASTGSAVAASAGAGSQASTGSATAGAGPARSTGPSTAWTSGATSARSGKASGATRALTVSNGAATITNDGTTTTKGVATTSAGIGTAMNSPIVSTPENWSLSGSPVDHGSFLTMEPDLSGTNRPKVALPANTKPSDATSTQKPATHVTKNTVHGFYAGALAGPDFTSIKGQAIQNPGYSLGLILGYRFSRRLSVEASALWDHKAYCTTGEYFNKKNSGIPDNVDIQNMNGDCSMFEIPLSLRYDFWILKNGGFYTTAGFSSYMMQLETYTYTATSPGGYNPWTGQKSYPHSGNDFFSMVHLSAGYRFQWGKIGEVRLEPYYKIPLKGVGVGELPMTSTGLYIGLTHSF